MMILRLSLCYAEEKTNDIWEISVKPKLSDQELEMLRWNPLFMNEVAQYFYEEKSINCLQDSEDEVEVIVKAVYKEQKLISKINELYKDKLENNNSVNYSEMKLIFKIKDRKYAISSVKIFDKNGVVIYEEEKKMKFFDIPVKTFVDSIYEIVRQYYRDI